MLNVLPFFLKISLVIWKIMNKKIPKFWGKFQNVREIDAYFAFSHLISRSFRFAKFILVRTTKFGLQNTKEYFRIFSIFHFMFKLLNFE